MSKASIPLVDAALAAHGQPVGGTDAQKVDRLAAWYRKHVDKKKLADCSTCGGVSDVGEPACPFCGDGAIEGPAVMHPEQVAAEAQAAVVIAKPHTEDDLNQAVARVLTLKQHAAERIWEFGNAVRCIFDDELWKLRKHDATGAPMHKTWGQFCEAELGITHQYSFKMMDVARAFTSDEVKQIGATKLYITLQVPKEAREKLLEAAKGGASRTELTQLAEQEGKEKRKTGRTKKGGAGAHKPDAKKGGRKAERVTVAALLTRVEIPLFKGAATDKRAKAIGDLPTGEERMMNGVKQRFVVTKDESGNLLLVVERTRE